MFHYQEHYTKYNYKQNTNDHKKEYHYLSITVLMLFTPSKSNLFASHCKLTHESLVHSKIKYNFVK